MLRLFLYIFLAALIPFGAHAKTSSPIYGMKESQISILVAEYNKDSTHPVVKAGMLFDQADNWYLYWKNPGDAGIPPHFDWTGSDNISNIKIDWPVPTRKVEGDDLEVYVYTKDVILPIEITPKDPKKPVKLMAKMNYAVCNLLCIPIFQEVALDIEPGDSDESNAKLINSFAANVPKTNGTNGFTIEKAQFVNETRNGVFLEVLATTATHGFFEPDLIIDSQFTDIKFDIPEITFTEGGKKALFRIRIRNSDEKNIDFRELNSQKFNLILTNESTYGISTMLDPMLGAYSWKDDMDQALSDDLGLLYAILFSIIGGFILNFMPCVLPVLSIKVLAILKAGAKESNAEIRYNFLLSSLGILVSYFILALITMIFLNLGHLVGFGFQFQEPLFLITMVIILTIFASNLLGFFEIHIPYKWNNKINDTLGRDHVSAFSHFLSGAFATLLATPCTAPFVGSAIGYALSRSNSDILIIFLSMGFGMAIPFITLTIFPSWVRLLPRPGHWMVTLKKIFGLFLLVTALWLVQVIATQLGILAAIMLFLLMILIKFFVKLKRGPLHKPIYKFTALFLIFVACYAIPMKVKVLNEIDYDQAQSLWKDFHEDQIDVLLDQGKIVVVDVTADWCLTCKLNKVSVFNRAEVIDFLDDPKIVALRANITVNRPEIIEYIKRYGRQGIPFNIVYGPKNRHGIVLSEFLTKSELFQAVKSAGLE